MAEVGPGPFTTGVPQFSAATGLVQAEFSRNPSRFALNRYARLVPVSKVQGYFLSIDEEEAMRIVTEQDYIWPDGNDAPEGEQVDNNWQTYACVRFAPSFRS